MIYKKLTIKDIARTSGVSTQTVSRVLNEREDVSAETRRRVLQVIKELDYRPSALARSMIRRRSSSIGVIISGLCLSSHLNTLDAIAAEADRLGYSLLLKTLPRFEPLSAGAALRSLLDRQIDGLIWAIPEAGNNHIALSAMELVVPTVFLNTDKRLGHGVVSTDHYGGAYLATGHLIQQGYRAIGHVSGPLNHWEARERQRGWEDALRDAGRPAPEQAVVEGDWSAAGGYQAVAQLFSQYPEMDAFFACNDHVALSGLLYAAQVGKKVPADLGVVGFDDIAEAAWFSTPLTTVSQDYETLGQTAVRRLANLIASWGKTDGLPSERVIIQPHLMIRESTSARNSGTSAR